MVNNSLIDFGGAENTVETYVSADTSNKIGTKTNDDTKNICSPNNIPMVSVCFKNNDGKETEYLSASITSGKNIFITVYPYGLTEIKLDDIYISNDFAHDVNNIFNK